MRGNGSHASLHLVKERLPQAWAFELIVLDGVVQLAVGEPVEPWPIRHLSFDRALLNTSAAERASSGAESQSASLRSASPAQSVSFSSSDRLSRLSSSLSARRARAFASSLSASASISSALMDRFYHVHGLRIGFEESSIVKEKTIESYIPAMKDHRQLYDRRPELRSFNALEHFRSTQEAAALPRSESPARSARAQAAPVLPVEGRTEAGDLLVTSATPGHAMKAPEVVVAGTVIDTSVWIPLLNGVEHPKVERAREVIEGPEDVGIPGIILEEILRGLRSDAQYRRVRNLLLNDFTYLEMSQGLFIRSAEIYRALRRRGKTIRSPADCLIAACAIEEAASLLEDDADFHTIAEVVPLKLVGES